MNAKMNAKLQKRVSEISKKETYKPFTKIRNSSKDKMKLYDLLSPGRQGQKSEFNKNNKLIMNTNPNNANNNTNSINNFNYNPTSPNSTSYNKQLSNKRIYKILNTNKNQSANNNINNDNEEYQNINSKKTHKKFYKQIKKNLLEKYLRINYYTKIQTDALVENRYSRIVAKLRDLIISNSADEFLRRYYKYQEIVERIPKIAKYYRNYLLFFCKPVFTNLFINKLIHVYGELKGELYYNANYGNKNKDNKEKEKAENNKNNKENNNNHNGKNINYNNNLIKKNNEMLFHTTIKNDIDKNSMTISTIVKDVSYLNMNPLNDDFFGSNAYYNNHLNSNNHCNLNRNGAAAPNKANFYNGKNAVFISNNDYNNPNFGGKLNFAGGNNFNNANANLGNVSRRGLGMSKRKSDNLVEFNHNNNYNKNFQMGNNFPLNEKLSMNIKAELGNLYNNLLNANANINGNFTNNNNKKSENLLRKDANKKGKSSSGNVKNAKEKDIDLPELDYGSLLTSENLNLNLAQKGYENNFTADSHNNSIVNILCTISENKNNCEDSPKKNADKLLTRREKKNTSNALSPKLASNNHWQNSSLINNPGSSVKISLNPNNINNNFALNLKSDDLITPKNFQNKFVLLETTKEANHVNPTQALSSTKANIPSINLNTNNNLTSKVSESLTKTNNNFKNYLNFVGVKNRIKGSGISSQLYPTKSDLKISQINTTNNILTSNFNLNNLNKANFSSKNIRNTSNNIFSTKHSNNNSDLIGSLDLKTEISNRLGSANNINLNNLNKNLLCKSTSNKPKNAETYRDSITNNNQNQLQQSQANLNKYHSKNNFSSRIDKKLFDFDSNFNNNNNNNNNLFANSNANKILASIQNNQERNASANSHSRLRFYSPDANAIKQLYNVSNLNCIKENASINHNLNSEVNNNNNNNNNIHLYNVTNSNFNNSNNLSGRKVMKRTFTVENKNKKNLFTNANINNNNNNNNNNYNNNNNNYNLLKINNSNKKEFIASNAINQNSNNNKKHFKLKDLFLNTNSNKNNKINKNNKTNLNHLNNFLTNTNIINTNGIFNTENNLILSEKNKKQSLLNTYNNELLNENLLSKFPSKTSILNKNNNNNNNNNNKNNKNLNFNSSNEDQLSSDMKITLNIKLKKNSNDLADIGRKFDISPLIPALDGYENNMIQLNDANLGIKNFNININNNINFNHLNSNAGNSDQNANNKVAGVNRLSGNPNQIQSSKVLSARKAFSKKKPNTKSSSLAINNGARKEMKIIQNNLNTNNSNNNNITKKKEGNNSKNFGFGDLVKMVNFKNLNLKNELLSPKKFYDKHNQQISSPKPLNISGSNILTTLSNNKMPNTAKNRKGESLNKKAFKINI